MDVKYSEKIDPKSPKQDTDRVWDVNKTIRYLLQKQGHMPANYRGEVMHVPAVTMEELGILSGNKYVGKFSLSKHTTPGSAQGYQLNDQITLEVYGRNNVEKLKSLVQTFEKYEDLKDLKVEVVLKNENSLEEYVNNCFIATAVYGTPNAPEIDTLRDFRDARLQKSAAGKALVNLYYNTSPPIADAIRDKDGLKGIVRKYFVQPAVNVSRKLLENN